MENGVTTYYPFEGYEARVNGTLLENTTYYYANGELVARKDSAGMHYYHGDQLGSMSMITDASGNVEETTRYYPFGALRSGGTKTKYLYTGQEYLSSVGLYDYGRRQRKTDPPMFMQPDPIMQNPIDPQTLNRYSYVRNNPVKYTDPTGESFLGLMIYKNRERYYADFRRGLQFASPAINEFNRQLNDPVTQNLLMCTGTLTEFKTVSTGLKALEEASVISKEEAVVNTVVKVNPNEIKFSQTTVKGSASGPGKWGYDELSSSMQSNGWQGSAVDVVQTSKGMTTIDNKRVLVAQDLGFSKIPVNVHSMNEPLPRSMLSGSPPRFGETATTWGDALSYRTGRQTPSLPVWGTEQKSNPEIECLLPNEHKKHAKFKHPGRLT
ncbi:MAG: RHS repeat-associated core domain-containing protein [Candidatus Altiarchaeia archaeon]